MMKRQRRWAILLSLLLLASELFGSAQAVFALEENLPGVAAPAEETSAEAAAESAPEEVTPTETPTPTPASTEEETQPTENEEEAREEETEEVAEEAMTEEAVAEEATEEAAAKEVLLEESAGQTATEKLGETTAQTQLTATEPYAAEFYTITVQLRGETKALEIRAGSVANRANAQIYKANGSMAQLFRLEKSDAKYYRIINVNSGKVLEIADNKKTNGANVQQNKWTGADAQLWRLKKINRDGGVAILSKLSGKALEVQGGKSENKTNVQVNAASESAAQTWYLTEKKAPLSIATFSTIKPQPYRGKALTPKVRIQLAGRTLVKNVDYTLTYAKNDVAGTARITVEGIGTIEGTKTLKFKIFQPAEAIASGKTYVLIPKKDTALAVDVCKGGIVNKTRLWLFKQNGTEAQKFTLTKNSDGSYSFVNQKSELSIDVKGNSQANKAPLQVYEANGTNAQKWIFRANNDGTFTIINKQSKKAIDVPGGKATAKAYLQMYKDNKTEAQKYYLQETTAVENKYKGKYMLVTRAKNYMVLDAERGGTGEGTNIRLWKGNRTKAQQFRFKYSGDGTYRIVNVKSGKVLTTKDNVAENKANIELRSWSGQKGQRFKIVDAGGGFVYLQNLHETVIDVPGANVSLGQNISTYKLNKSNAQKWKITKPADVPIYQGTQAADYTAIGERAYQGNEAAKKQIIQVYANAADEAFRRTNYPRSVLIAQAILECGWMSFHETVVGKRKWNGVSGMLPKYNNILGMNKDLGSTKWNTPWDGKYVYAAVPQSYLVSASNPQGLRVETMRQYVDIETCFLDYAMFRTAKFGAIKKGTSAESVITNYLPGYASNPQYLNKIRDIVKKYNLTQYDK